MQNPLMQTIEALAKEKGIEADTIITAIEDAVLTASRKYYKTNENLKTRFNQETGQVDLFAIKHIVQDVEDPSTQISLKEAQDLYGEEAEVDMEIEFPKRTDVLGRIAAQTAKQVIFQKVREAERENIFAEYNQRIGEVINTTVKRFESGDLIVEIGRVEAVLPRKEQSRAESYTPGERIRAVIKGVNRSAKGPQIVMSRTDPALLIKLFEQEVPEIYDGTVMIRGAVREAGDRAKVAVYSRERDVDPVGACVGMKGTRVQAIIRELRGEKIDIVEWSDDPVLFVTNALSPAKVQRVTIVDDGERVMEVVVEDKQLSLAIGKKGQNVRLAAKLTGWRIDIKSEEEKRREVEAQLARMQRVVEELRSLEGVGEKTIQKLIDVGVGGLEHLLAMTDEELTSIEGVGPKTVEKIREAATLAKQEWDRRDAEEAARQEAERLAAEQAAAEEEARRQAEEQAAAEAEAAAAAEEAAAAAAETEGPAPAVSAAAEGEPAPIGE